MAISDSPSSTYESTERGVDVCMGRLMPEKRFRAVSGVKISDVSRLTGLELRGPSSAKPLRMRAATIPHPCTGRK